MTTNFNFNINCIRNPILPDPIGFNMTYTESSSTIIQDVDGVKTTVSNLNLIKKKKAKELATGQFGQIFQTLLTFYFVGGTLNIFSIFFVGMFAFNSLKSIMNFHNSK